MDGFFKMYRSYLENHIWKEDRTAWHIFEYFLGKCDYKTGAWTIDYGTMSEYLGIPRATLHKAIKRLKKAKMVNDKVNEKNTTFTIVNWHKYQCGEQNGERKVNAKGTQSEHIKEIKNIRSNNKGKKNFRPKTLKVCSDLGINPSHLVDKYVNDLYPHYSFKRTTLECLAWCEEKDIKPTASVWKKFVDRAIKKKEMDVLDDIVN